MDEELGPNEGYSDSPKHLGFPELADWVCIRFTGADRREWLHGQTTQDILALQDGESRCLAFASSTGQCECLGSFLAGTHVDLLITERAAAQIIISRVAEFVIMEDVQADLTDYIVIESVKPHARFEPIWGIDFPRTHVALGWDCYKERGSDWGEVLVFLPPHLSYEFPSFAEYNRNLLVPELGEFLYSQLVAKDKGCYVGQEILHRIAARGKVKGYWERLLVIGDPPHVGATTFGKVLHTFKDGFRDHKSNYASCLIKSELDDQHKFEWEGGSGVRTIRIKGVSA